MQNKNIKFLIIAICVLVIFLLGWFSNLFFQSKQNNDSKLLVIRENSPEYKYINPLLLNDNFGSSFPQYVNLKKSIEDYISNAINKNNAQSVSMYFRDLNTGKWTGVGENEPYVPSSMLKVGVLIAYFKVAEKDSSILDKKLLYTPKNNPLQFYKPTHLLTPGYHTVRDLIQQMIVESDNDALNTLSHEYPEEISNVFSALKILYPSESPDDFLSASVYSRLFRTLYNGTYLSHANSEEALKLLTYTSFNKGLVAGVASSTIMAHKFGEHSVFEGNILSDRELHDCGIVYYPQKPYFLCVMTKGKNFANLEKIISDISKIVFTDIN